MIEKNFEAEGQEFAMATKFSEKFAINMLKKHRKICRRGLTHLDAIRTHFQKNHSDTFETPCRYSGDCQ